MILVSCWMILSCLNPSSAPNFSFISFIVSSAAIIVLSSLEKVGILQCEGRIWLCWKSWWRGCSQWRIYCICGASLLDQGTIHWPHAVPMLCVGMLPQRLTIWCLEGQAGCCCSWSVLLGLHRLIWMDQFVTFEAGWVWAWLVPKDSTTVEAGSFCQQSKGRRWSGFWRFVWHILPHSHVDDLASTESLS